MSSDAAEHGGLLTSPAGARVGTWRVAVFVVIVFVMLFARAMGRPFDPDEHQFVVPALLLRQGLLPYVDYPLFHMPALVPIYAAVTSLSENALLATRAFSAVMGTLIALMVLLASHAWMRGHDPGTRWRVALGLSAIVLAARVFTFTNGRSWNHDPSIVALLAAVLLFLWSVERGRVWPAMIVGALLGLSLSIRLSTAPAMGALGLAALLVPSVLTWRQRVGACVLAGVGCVVALSPSIAMALRAPEAMRFGNLTYPALYANYVLADDPKQYTQLGKLGHLVQTFFTDPGNAAAAGLFVFAVVRVCVSGAWRSARRVWILLGLLPFLWIGVAAPFQIQMQYHSVLLPFVLLTVAAVAATDGGRSVADRKWLRAVPVVAVVVCAINFPRWYWKVIELPTPSKWTPMEVQAAARWMASMVPAGGRVLTTDPLIALQGGMKVYPEFATGRFTFHVGPYTTDEQREMAKMLWGPQLERRLVEEPPAAVMSWSRFEWPQLPSAARRLGFERHTYPLGPGENNDAVLWVAPGAGAR